MVQTNFSLSSVITAIAVILMFSSLSPAASSTSTAVMSSTSESTVTSGITSSTTDSSSTQSSVSASSTAESSTTTEAATTMAPEITCYNGSCTGAACLSNITTKCNSTMYCKLEKMSNSTSTSYYLSCADTTCTGSDTVYCCKTSDCNNDESKLNSNGSGHPIGSGMVNLLAIIVTFFVTRQVITWMSDSRPKPGGDNLVVNAAEKFFIKVKDR